VARIEIDMPLLEDPEPHDELRQQNADLARLNAAIAHELRNPLITISNFLCLARKDAAASESARLETDFDQIQLAAYTMSGLLEELSEYSRLFYEPPSRERLSLDHLVHHVLELRRGEIAAHHAEVRLSSHLPQAYGNPAQLASLWKVLLSNALKFAHSDKPQVEIGMRNEGEAPVFFVRDNGCGVDPRYHEQIFELFERLDAVTSGAGVGLALAKRVVSVHGGRIWIESEGTPGEGSALCFTLAPRADATRPTQP
jgi:light-regulated signal transduction histidine kinase (bacteriophytochrome)